MMRMIRGGATALGRGRFSVARTLVGAAAFVIAAIGTFGAQPAKAAPVDPFVDLASAGPAYYGILELGGASGTPDLDLSAVTVKGNVGVGAGGTVTNMAPSKIVGNLFESKAGQISGPGGLTGTTTVSAPTLLANVTAAQKAATDAVAPTAAKTFTYSNITSATTITGVVGINLIKVTGNITLNNANLTLSGPAGAKFVIDVAGNVKLTGTASLLTSGGVSNSNVLYNFTGSSSTITTKVGDVVDGIFLESLVGQSMNLDGTFNGELIGTNIALLSNATVNQPAVVPEPTSLALLAGALAGLTALRSRKSRQPVSHQPG